MKAPLTFFILIHGLIHLLRFAWAFRLSYFDTTSRDIPTSKGILWLLAAILFISTALLYYYDRDYWWIISCLAILLSQYLIFTSWEEAWIGSFINTIIVLSTIIGYGSWNFNHQYQYEVNRSLSRSDLKPGSVLTESDIQDLPGPVKKYIRYTGAIGMPKVNYFKAEFNGFMRKSEVSEWMPIITEQYDFPDFSTRLFFMNATMNHFPVSGFHYYNKDTVFMDIRLLSLFKVEYESGKEMRIAETVTFFNDMCCLAPATLIDRHINWVPIDSNQVEASFTNNGITVSAALFFNEKGELINFVSDDRYAVTENNTMKKLRWSTPLKNYAFMNGHRLAGYAETIYRYPTGDLCYGRFFLKNVEYNCEGLR